MPISYPSPTSHPMNMRNDFSNCLTAHSQNILIDIIIADEAIFYMNVKVNTWNTHSYKHDKLKGNAVKLVLMLRSTNG